MEIIATHVPGADPPSELACPPAGATMVEVRADLLDSGMDLAALVSLSPLPIVVTLRSAAEGGRGPDDGPARRAFFERWAAIGAAFFDLEAARDLELLAGPIPAEKTILSLHLPDTPADLEERARSLLTSPARLVKLVPTARSLDDVVAVLSLQAALDRGQRHRARAIVFAAGAEGRATRLLGCLLTAPIAYCAWAEDRVAAPGQYTPEDLLGTVGHLHGRPRRLFGVVGRGVGGSLSPRLHAAAYRALALPNAFVPLEVADEEELDRVIGVAGESCFDRIGLTVGGWAVTTPWKSAAAGRCTVLAPRAQRARAVNTVLPRKGKVLGDTTDIDGVVGLLLDDGVAIQGSSAMVLGTGGAARAVAVGLDLAGARVAIAARDQKAATATARELGLEAVEPGGLQGPAIVVNATPAGREGECDTVLESIRVAEGSVVVDLPYGSVPTRLEHLAAEHGWSYLGGREVLLFQGIAQFAAMNSVSPPVRAMAAALSLPEVQG